MEAKSGSTTPAGGPATAPATVLHGGKRIALMNGGLTIGRLPDNDVTVAKEAVSRHHAKIEAAQGGFWIADLGSRNGTKLNGERFSGESRWLANGDTIVIGGGGPRVLPGGGGGATRGAPPPAR